MTHILQELSFYLSYPFHRSYPSFPPSPLCQSPLKVFISKSADHLAVPVLFHHSDPRKGNTVKCIIFHHGINSHILKIQLISHLNLFIKGIIPDHISCQTGTGGKTVGKLLFS